MEPFTLNPEITVGNVLTIATIVISFIGLLTAWYQDRKIKKKEHADRVRRAAGTITAKLERWKEISLHFFDGIQGSIIDVDIRITKDKDSVTARDYLCQHLAEEHAKSLQKILDEMIEIAYVDLYGYDPRIRDLFVGAIRRLKLINRNTYIGVMYKTQTMLRFLASSEERISSGQLGNLLREVCGAFADEYDRQIEGIIDPFRTEMIKLIKMSDREIFENRLSSISTPDKIFPEPSAKHLLIDQPAYIEACSLAISHKGEEALNVLEKALKMSPELKEIAWNNPDFIIIRDHPRFETICKFN